MKKFFWVPLVAIVGLGVLCVVLVSNKSNAADDKPGGDFVTTNSGLKYQDTKAGDGAAAKAGDAVVVNYTGWLTTDGGKTKGKKFDSSVGKKPFSFPLGAGRVIKGWDEGVAGMKVGGKRTLVIPPDLGYGGDAQGDDIPANSTLLFEVELLAIK